MKKVMYDILKYEIDKIIIRIMKENKVGGMF